MIASLLAPAISIFPSFSLYRVLFQTFRTPLPIMFLFRSVVLVRIQGHKMSTKSTANEIADPESGEVDFAANKGEEGGERCRDKVIGGGEVVYVCALCCLHCALSLKSAVPTVRRLTAARTTDHHIPPCLVWSARCIDAMRCDTMQLMDAVFILADSSYPISHTSSLPYQHEP